MTLHILYHTAGPPPAPTVNPITLVDESSISSILLISWSESNCAVQYVVAIINSSVYHNNITTSNTNTALTLPTGVEFCFILVAVDSVGRRGPDNVPICYRNGENWCQNVAVCIVYTWNYYNSAVSPTSSSVNQLFSSSPLITNSTDQRGKLASTCISILLPYYIM